MSVKMFNKKTVKKIAKEYIFTNTTYNKLAKKYNCSETTISNILNHDLANYSKLLYFIADLKAAHNCKKNRNKWFSHK